jgi:hypothetical protein
LASRQSGNSGGGIYNSGTLTLTGSTIANNTASGGPGGGISNDLGGTLTLLNSTIVGNTSTDDAGGGISTSGGRTSLVFCTVYGNTAHGTGGGIFTAADSSTQQAPGQGQFKMTNSLVAQNRAASGPDLAGVLISGGYNLIEEPAGFSVTPSNGKPGTDLIGQGAATLRIDPQLQEQSGPAGQVWVLALLAGSSAIDPIPLAACHPGGITTDQRGVKRPQGPACDIGSYEYVPSS